MVLEQSSFSMRMTIITWKNKLVEGPIFAVHSLWRVLVEPASLQRVPGSTRRRGATVQAQHRNLLGLAGIKREKKGQEKAHLQ